jgi:Protein of unknown function (DUF2971)
LSDVNPGVRLGHLIASFWPINEPGPMPFLPSSLARFSREKIFYHYTTVSGLFGILRDNAVWASHMRYMNDVSEYVHGRDMAVDILEKMARKARFQSFAAILNGSASMLSEGKTPDYFIASFSTIDDDLTQWRAYGQDQGVSVGFDISRSDSFLHFWAVNTLVTIYRDRQKMRAIVFWIVRFFSEFVKDFEFYSGSLPDTTYDSYRTALTDKLQHEFIRFKHISFESERETRFVINDKVGNASFRPRRHRVSGKLIIPYHHTSDQIWRQQNGIIMEPPKLPICSVTIGPITSQDICAQSVREFLEFHGHDPSVVRASQLPYRSH